MTSVTVKGTKRPLDPAANYRIAANDFMYNGGDNYTMFKQGTNPVIYSDQVLYDVISGYFKYFRIVLNKPLNQQIEGRISTTA